MLWVRILNCGLILNILRNSSLNLFGFDVVNILQIFNRVYIQNMDRNLCYLIRILQFFEVMRVLPTFKTRHITQALIVASAPQACVVK